MQHEPSRFLGNLQVFCELRRCNALFVGRDQPDSGKPLAQRQLGILENRADLDRKPLAAVMAFVGFLVREVHDALRGTVWAIGAVAPAD